jgi:hypothetical protein
MCSIDYPPTFQTHHLRIPPTSNEKVPRASHRGDSYGAGYYISRLFPNKNSFRKRVSYPTEIKKNKGGMTIDGHYEQMIDATSFMGSGSGNMLVAFPQYGAVNLTDTIDSGSDDSVDWSDLRMRYGYQALFQKLILKGS